MEASQGLDQILNELGFGRWNFFMLLPYVCWGCVLPYFSLGGAFYNPVLEHTCSVDMLNNTPLSYEEKLNFSIPWEMRSGTWERSRCMKYELNSGNESWLNTSQVPVKCDAWDYDTSVFQDTVAKEWNLVCDNAGWGPFFQSFYFIGAAFGDSFLGHLSDRYGRRTLTRICLLLMPLASMVLTMTSSYFVVLICRFIMGIMHAAMGIAYVLAMESCPSEKRALIGLSLNGPIALTGICFGVIAYFIRSWRTLHLVCSIPPMVVCIVIPFMEESSRWLILQKREEEAIRNLQRAALWHGVDLKPKELRNTILEFQKAQFLEENSLWSLDDQIRNHEKPRDIRQRRFLQNIFEWIKEFFDFFRTPVLRRISILIFFCWFFSGLAYWGMSLAGVNFSQDPFLYMIIGCVLEFIGYTAIFPLVKKFGRKLMLSVTFGLSSVAILSILVIPKEYTALIFTFASIGKLFITSSYNIMYLYTSEVFPTSVRSRGFNGSSMMARLGSILSPFVVEILALYYWWAPSVAFGSCALLGSAMALLLPETKEMPLADTIEQFEAIYSTNYA